MKILIVNKFLYPNGGSETYIFKIGEQLEKMGHQIQYFGMEHEGRIVGNRVESYTSNMDFHTGKLQKLLYPLKIIYSVEARKKIRRVLEDFQPDAVHLNNFNFQLTPSILYEIRDFEKRSGQRVRIVYTAHDSQLVCPNHLMQNPLTKERCTRCMETGVVNCIKGKCIHGSRIKSVLAAMEHWIYRRLKTYRLIDRIICPSEFLKARLATDPVLASRLTVMHNFVDVSLPEEGLRKKDYVLYFGRYSEEKGIRTLLKAVGTLPEIPFVFVGDGPLRGAVEEMEQIENKGFLSGSALYESIGSARFSIFPSECYENCPFAVMESLLCRTPVIGADAGGVPELIERGKTGELFPCGDADRLADCIHRLWNDPGRLEKYTENCREVKFDTPEEYCLKLCRIYQGEGNEE